MNYFDINNYVLWRLYLVFFIGLFININIFRRKIYSVFDPLLHHLVWISSMNAVCFELLLEHSDNMWTFFFCLVSLYYTFNIFIFSKQRIRENSILLLAKQPNYFHYFLLINAFLILFFSDYINKWNYLLNNGIFASAIYKFELVNRAKPLYETIAIIVLYPVYEYISFYVCFFEKRMILRILVMSLLVHNLIINTVTGSRSATMSMLLSLGFFCFYFRRYINQKNTNRLFNRILLVAAPMTILSLVLVTALYMSKTGDINLNDGWSVTLNRIFANADGLDYFVKLDGDQFIDTWGFIKYNFGVFLNRIGDNDEKNQSLGWKLMELATGRKLNFSQGPNFMIYLQSLMFFSPLLAPIYITLTTFFLLKIRYMKSNNLSIKDIWIYSIAKNSLSFFVDSETFIYRTLISSVFFFISYCFSLCLNEKKRKTYAEW
jgi:hypothetical protein